MKVYKREKKITFFFKNSDGVLRGGGKLAIVLGSCHKVTDYLDSSNCLVSQ